MSPIRPENRDRYPADWPQISLRIREDRAGGRCECTGRCGRDHEGEAASESVPYEPGRCEAENGKLHPQTGSKVVLTVAHLDHTPENCDQANLLAMCQRCHLAYDQDHHADTRAATRAAVLADQMDPLLPVYGEPEPTAVSAALGIPS